MTELHFMTTLFLSFPRKGHLQMLFWQGTKNFAVSTVFLCFSLPTPKRLKDLSSITNIRLPNTYFLLYHPIAKSSSVVYKHIPIPLRKVKKFFLKYQTFANVCAELSGGNYQTYRGATRQTTLNLFGRYFKGPSRCLLVTCPKAEIASFSYGSLLAPAG